jgi:uncharacterized protein YehS (DUF1456 family)
MTNNDVLKKLRVAIQLRNDEIIEILKLVEFKATESEIGALFRSEDHPKYKNCYSFLFQKPEVLLWKQG